MMSLRGAGIAGIGMCVPERVLTNADLEKMVDTTDDWIVSRTGIRERRIAGPDEATSDFAVGAAQEALATAGLKPTDLDLIIVATCTGDTNALPAIFAARAKSKSPSFSPSSTCDFAAKPNSGFVPHTRTSGFAAASAPTGHFS